MPIKNLTDTQIARPTLIGKLRKGSPKGDKHIGTELDHFRFASETGWEHANALFTEAYGDQPQEITVKLPYKYVDENLSSWYYAWAAGGLLRRCDGETCSLHRENSKANFNNTPVECPLRTNPGEKCPYGCKATGYLSLILPKLRQPGLVTLETHSINDLKNLYGSLLDAFEKLGDLRDVPFRLSRRHKEINAPVFGKDKKPTGEKQKRSKWLVFIEIDPSWFNLMLQVHESRRRKSIMDGIQFTALPSATQIPALPPVDMEEDLLNGFKPLNRKDGTNASRFQSVANALGLGMDVVKGIIEALFPGKHSSQLGEAHCEQVVDGLLCAYAVARQHIEPHAAQELLAAYKPIGNDLEKVQSWIGMLDSSQQPIATTVEASVYEDHDDSDDDDPAFTEYLENPDEPEILEKF